MNIKVWSEKVTIPTYEIGAAEKNPIFLEKRVYQGSSGKVYPYPVVEKISDEKINKEWNACFLENDFIKIMILPELGGRVQMAYDKIKKRHFVYYNEVIKPALVGLTGPWISGGIEFNWPQHHRPSTYSAIDYCIEDNEDGSKTVWCSEIERMSGTKGMAGFTLYPDKAYLEINVKLYNRTTQPQTFLWWANPAVVVNDDYQSVFPPDVNAVFDHGKRDVSEFPIAKGVYYKHDYSPGTDISRYKNIPVPTSYMAIKSDYNFVGGYENDTKGGLLHVANHHVSPGKKQWTWGDGDFGKAWDRNLTDSNGPYIELMCGVYTDNQPDFSWLMPYEEKTFTQYFMPYQELGVVKNASKDAMLNLEFEKNKIILKVYATGIFPNTKVQLTYQKTLVYEDTFDFKPGSTYLKEIDIDTSLDKHLYQVVVIAENGKSLIDWKPEKDQEKTIPNPAKPALEPKEIRTNEELYLNGQHLEQYRHATYSATDYYQEALKRDPKDVRCNNAMGLYLLRKGRFEASESYFKKAYERQIERNPNPYDGEPLFNLGLSLQYQGRTNEAYEAFYKSVWNAAYMDSGYFKIAQIEALRNNWESTLETVQRSLVRNWNNHKARHLKAITYRVLGEKNKAISLIEESLELDNFNFGMHYEHYLLGYEKSKSQLLLLMRNSEQNHIEIALDYSNVGRYDEAINLLDFYITSQGSPYPMALYYKAWFLTKLGRKEQAFQITQQAEECVADYCFPHRLESVLALQSAIKINPEGAKAPYYLGNFWYDAKQYDEAVTCWESSVKNDDSFPTVHRNLALAYYNKRNEPTKALNSLEIAFKLDKTDARVFMELDQLYKKLNKSVEFRFSLYEKHEELVISRDDLYIEKSYLYIVNQKYSEAYEWIMSRKFHPWEGGEGKVTKAYTTSLLGLAKESFYEDEFLDALKWLEKARVYPHNLGEGKLPGTSENEIDYWCGCVYDVLGKNKKAKSYWERASGGNSEPSIVWFYNDQPPEAIFFQGLALLKLGNQSQANSRFEKLIAYGKEHLNDTVKIDYFAVSLPDLMIWEENLNDRNKMHCLYLIALGYKATKGMEKESMESFQEVLAYDCTHFGATIQQLIKI